MANFLKMKQFKQSKIVKIVLETHKQQQIRLLLATIAEIDLNWANWTARKQVCKSSIFYHQVCLSGQIFWWTWPRTGQLSTDGRHVDFRLKRGIISRWQASRQDIAALLKLYRRWSGIIAFQRLFVSVPWNGHNMSIWQTCNRPQGYCCSSYAMICVKLRELGFLADFFHHTSQLVDAKRTIFEPG